MRRYLFTVAEVHERVGYSGEGIAVVIFHESRKRLPKWFVSN